jgi:hypothetical protein
MYGCVKTVSITAMPAAKQPGIRYPVRGVLGKKSF